jgi:hypothetical protein
MIVGTRTIQWVTLAVSAALLGGCGLEDVRLLDKARADASAAIKANYDKANVVGIVGDQRKNLDALLAAELEIVRDNQQLQLDISLLALADNETPMADTWKNKVLAPLAAMGFPTAEAARDPLDAADEVENRKGQLAGLARRFKKTTGTPPPACGRRTKFDQSFQNKSTKHKIYAKSCEALQSAWQVLDRANTAISIARLAVDNAEQAKADRAEEIKNARIAMADTKKAHKDAVAAVAKANNKADDIRKAVAKNSAALQKGLAEGTKLAPEILAEERIGALVTLLKAAAGEETKVEKDEDLSRAVLIVGGVSSLGADIAGMVATAKAPSVANLLIELQHQTVILEHAKALEALDVRRLEIYRAKLNGYVDELEALQNLRDAICSFAFHMAGEDHPGTACDQFEVSEDGKVCKTTAVNITDCALAKPWNHYLKSPPSGADNKDRATREMYKALIAYTHTFPARATRIEQDFLLVDLKHRENLANREMALRAWNNLAAVPIGEIAAYYQAGLKPEAIADLLVKALGFTAITVGVSQ